MQEPDAVSAGSDGSAPPVSDEQLFAGLQELASSAFPKACASCGRRYATVDDYVHQTADVRGRTGFKQSYDDDGHIIVELFRNCVCGSTLMNSFGNRRETSAEGVRQRERFSTLIEMLIAQGMARSHAQVELIKILHGEPSEVSRLLPRG